MNRTLSRLRIQRTSHPGGEMLAQAAKVWIKLQQPNIQCFERVEKSHRHCRCGRRQNQKGSVGEKTIPGRLHQAFPPVFELRFDSCETKILQRQYREVLILWGLLPSHEKDVGTSKTIQGKLPPCGTLRLGFSELRQICLLKLRQEVDLPALGCRHSRQIATRVVTAESDSGMQAMGGDGHLARLLTLGTGHKTNISPTQLVKLNRSRLASQFYNGALLPRGARMFHNPELPT